MIFVVRLEKYEEKNEIVEAKFNLPNMEREMQQSLTAHKYGSIRQGEVLVITAPKRQTGLKRNVKEKE